MPITLYDAVEIIRELGFLLNNGNTVELARTSKGKYKGRFKQTSKEFSSDWFEETTLRKLLKFIRRASEF